MKLLFKKPRTLMLMFTTLLLMGCSKSVQWVEEVPLNPGTNIWIKRTDSYARASEPGNPLKLGWRLQKRELEFDWEGQPVRFQTDASDIILLHELESLKSISIVAWTQDCTKRGYGEFRWLDGRWKLQPTVNSELVGRTRNVMGYFSSIEGGIPERVTQAYVSKSRFDLPQNGGFENQLLTSRVALNCSER